jgi:hypothetical protein
MSGTRSRKNLTIEAMPKASVAAAACFLGAAGWLVEPAGGAQAEGDDRAIAQSLIQPLLEGGPVRVSAEEVARAKEALDRANRLHIAGDEAHARAADGLAREWAEAARDLELAVAAEKMAAERRREAMRAEAQLQRTRTLVEEGIARVGRVEAKLGATAPPSTTKVRAAVDVSQAPAAGVGKP